MSALVLLFMAGLIIGLLIFLAWIILSSQDTRLDQEHNVNEDSFRSLKETKGDDDIPDWLADKTKNK